MSLAYLCAAPGIPVQGPSGASAHVRGIVAALRRREPTRLYAARDVDHRGVHGPTVDATVTGVPGWPSWLHSYRELREVWSSRRLARRVIEDSLETGRPRLLIERHSLFSDAAWRAGDRLGVPWILEVNAPLQAERARFEEVLQPRWASRWEAEVIGAAPLVVTVSTWLADWARALGAQRVAVLPNGTDLGIGDRQRGRAILGIGPDERCIGFIGTPRPWHGADLLPVVAAAVGATAIVLGTAGPQHVPISGHLHGQDLTDAVAALDVALAPYPADAPPWFCPMKVVDARSQGTPVVATDVGAMRDLVGEGGSVVRPAQVDALIDAARFWLARDRPPVWRRSWDDVAAELLALAPS